MSDIKTFGSRAEVFHGTAKKTSGGLKKGDLMLKGGEIKSKSASKAALARMESEGKKAMVKVFKPRTGGKFKLQPAAGLRHTRGRLRKCCNTL